MATWGELIEAVEQLDDESKGVWLNQQLFDSLQDIGKLRGSPSKPRNVVMYGSSFLQKPGVPPEFIILTQEDLNGFMNTIHGMDSSRGLSLIMHTPGGVTNAAETVVSYLRSKFPDVEVIVPTFAMSAGTMISLASDRIVMGRQSQLGPIDPQMPILPGRTVSARAIVEEFQRASGEVAENQRMAHVWAPVLQSYGPALVQEAQNALDYSEKMVATWLSQHMFAGHSGGSAKAKQVASHFNDAMEHKDHGHRIGREEVAGQGLVVELLEDDQDLQDAVLHAYHVMTILFENMTMTKIIAGDQGRAWTKNFGGFQQ